MPANVIEYDLIDRPVGEENFIWQYDFGQKIQFKNIDLPFSYEVHFANRSVGPAEKQLGDASGVVIPYNVTKTGKPVYFWLYVTGENKSVTIYGNHVPVRARASVPTTEPTPEEQSFIEQALGVINDAMEVVEEIPDMVIDEIEKAIEEGKIKGDPGAVFTPHITDGVMTWTNNGDLPNPDPTDFNQELGLDNYATKQELNGKVDSGLIGSANGVAGLDASGRVPSEQLPSYVDDVLEFASVSQFPMPGESGKIYISLSNNHQYRWTGTQYIDITSGDLATTKADKRDTVLESTLSRDRKTGSGVGVGSFAFGEQTEASGMESVAFGRYTKASSTASFAEGSFTEATGHSAHAEGLHAKATHDGSHAEGNYTQAKNVAAHAEGYYADAEGQASHAEGYRTLADEDYSHAEGYYTKALEDHSHAEGYYSEARAERSHAEGSNTIAGGAASHSEGNSTSANGDYSHAEGNQSSATGDCAHAEGSSTIASGLRSHAEGGGGGTFTRDGTTYIPAASGESSHVEGVQTVASSTGSHAEGNTTVASGAYAHAEGQATTASGISSHAEGAGTKATGAYGSHAEGASTTASGSQSHAEGSGTTASGPQAHSEGLNTTASGYQSHVEGTNTRAEGHQSHAEGYGGTFTLFGTQYTSKAAGTADHTEGYLTATAVNGNPGHHAEGYQTAATGGAAHSEGSGTLASGIFSHSEGYNTKASNYCTHAEGSSTTASGAESHAEGYNTTASGAASHAEGYGTTASGTDSHAEGFDTIATGADSHVSGRHNIADSYANWTEWTQGEHCVPGDKRKRTRLVDEQTVVEGFVCKTENTDSDWIASHWTDQAGRMNYAEIVGNGTDNNARSNAYCLDWDGNGHFAGDVYVGCNPNGSGGTKLENTVFATDNEVQAIISGYGVSA